MKNIVKKLVTYSMVGIMQVGLGASIVSASPAHGPERVQYSADHHNQDNDRQREHDRRLREENARHDREMQQRHGEGIREWHERQAIENERHNAALNDIEAFLLGAIVGAVINGN